MLYDTYFINGIGHSGTRLMVDILNYHKDIFVPYDKLNDVNESLIFHEYSIECEDKTKISDSEWYQNKSKLFKILEDYFDNTSKKITVLKFTFYPLICMNVFEEYFNQNSCTIITKK